MNRYLSIFFLCLSLTAQARGRDSLAVNRPSDGWFVGAGAGIQGFLDINRREWLLDGGVVSPSFEVYGGKWFTPEFGARVGLQAGPMGHFNTEKFNYFYLHNDLLLDPVNLFSSYRRDRNWSIQPYGHFGLVLERRGGQPLEREFGAGAGIMGMLRLGGGPWSLTADGRLTLLNGKATQGLGIATSNALTLGARYDFNERLWHRSSGSEVIQGGFFQDWFLSAGLGVTLLNTVDFQDFRLDGRFAPAAELSAGKWLTPAVGLRAGVQGLRYGRVGMSNFGFFYPHLDLLWNLSHTVHPDELDRFWTFVPYVHYGLIWEYDPSTRKTLEREYAAGGGLLNQIRFCGPVSLFVDLRAQLLTAAASRGKTHSVGLAALGGLTLDINRSGWKRPVPILPAEQERYLADRFLDNWFVWGGVGVNTYWSVHRKLRFNGRLTPALDGGVGRFLSPYAAVRLGLGGVSLSAWGTSPKAAVRSEEGQWHGSRSYRETAGMLYAHGDVLWNLGNTLYGYNPFRSFDLYPYLHFGVLSEFGKNGLYEHEYAAGAGLLASMWLTNRLGVLLDLRGTVMTAASGLDRSDSHPLGLSAQLGVLYALGKYGWDPLSSARKGDVLMNGIERNWWLSVLGGINSIGALKGFDGRVSPAVDLALGKWLSPQFGLRLGWQGLGWQFSSGDRRDFGYLHGDVLWNVLNTWIPYTRERRWDLAPYLHMGYLRETETGGGAVVDRTYAAGAGLLGSYRLAEGLNLVLDARGALLPSGAAGPSIQGRVLALSLLGGLSFDLGQRGWEVWGAETEAVSLRRIPHSALGLGAFADNWFVSVSAGGNLGVDPGRKGIRLLGAPTGGGEVAIGKWASPDFGFRAGYQGISLGMSGQTAGYSYLHADLLWNFSRSVTALKKHLWEAVPYMHFGLLYEWDTASAARKRVEREFASGAGLLNLFHVHENVAVTADLRGTLLTHAASVDKHIGIGGAGSLLLGLQYSFDPSSRERSRHEAGSFLDHWFLNLSGGAQYAGRFQIATDVSLGKWFSPELGARGGWQGLRIRGTKGPSYGLHYIHGDFLWDFTNSVFGYKADRLVSVIPYVHMGILNEANLDRKGLHERDFAAGAGLLGAVRLSSRMDLTGDVRGSYLKGDISLGKPYLVSAFAGVRYHLGERDFQHLEKEEVKTRDKRNWAVSINLADLADLGTGSASIQYGIARHWSLEGGFRLNPWMPKENLYDKVQRFSLGARWWPWYIYSGWWLQGSARVEGFKRSGIPMKASGIGEAYGIGVSGGYSLILCPWLNLDFGLGGWGGRQRLYDGTRRWFAEPEATLGVMFVF